MFRSVFPLLVLLQVLPASDVEIGNGSAGIAGFPFGC